MKLCNAPKEPCARRGFPITANECTSAENCEYQSCEVIKHTAKEQACIQLRIPASGNAELDELIRKARRQEIAERIMQGLAGNQGALKEFYDLTVKHGGRKKLVTFMAENCLEITNALIAELEKEEKG